MCALNYKEFTLILYYSGLWQVLVFAACSHLHKTSTRSARETLNS